MLIVFVTHGYCLYIKGTSEILTKLCRWHVVVHQQGGPTDCGDIEFAEIDDFSEGNITRTIIFYANQTASKPRWTMVDEVCIFGVAVQCNSFVAGAIQRHWIRPDATNQDCGHRRPSQGGRSEGS